MIQCRTRHAIAEDAVANAVQTLHAAKAKEVAMQFIILARFKSLTWVECI